MKPASTTDVELLGVPFDANSSYLRGPAEAPERIREALFSGASNLSAEDGTDLAQRLHDGGDVAFDDDDDFRPPIERAVAAILDRGHRPLVLGGDHSITWPVVRAMSRAHPGLELVLFDAHPDLYDTFDGSRTSHACPFARILEEGLGIGQIGDEQVGL